MARRSGSNEKRLGKVAVASISCGFLLVLFLFHVALAESPPLAEALKLPSFGNGLVQVRLYTDYFCGPCSRMEPRVGQLLSDLVKKKIITFTLVDTPIHPGTPLYAKYFLYILNANRTTEHALQSRAILFEAAKDKIEEQDKLEEFLRRKGVKFRESDHLAVFATFSSLISEDAIKSTPTCVIIRDGRKNTYSGETEIVNALQQLK